MQFKPGKRTARFRSASAGIAEPDGLAGSGRLQREARTLRCWQGRDHGGHGSPRIPALPRTLVTHRHHYVECIFRCIEHIADYGLLTLGCRSGSACIQMFRFCTPLVIERTLASRSRRSEVSWASQSQAAGRHNLWSRVLIMFRSMVKAAERLGGLNLIPCGVVLWDSQRQHPPRLNHLAGNSDLVIRLMVE